MLFCSLLLRLPLDTCLDGGGEYIVIATAGAEPPIPVGSSYRIGGHAPHDAASSSRAQPECGAHVTDVTVSSTTQVLEYTIERQVRSRGASCLALRSYPGRLMLRPDSCNAVFPGCKR